MSVISLEHVTKRFSGHTAVRDFSMEVPGGGIYGLLGPNGAGKTTTIRMIMNIFTPDEGRISLFDGQGTSHELSDRIGFLPEERGLYKKMKLLDQLAFLGETKGLRHGDAVARAKRWLARLGLEEWTMHKVEDLSKGMQQKAQFIGALLHDPDLLVLDEPFSGLDPVNSQVMKEVVVEVARSGRTVLFSTHIMEQAERMCDRVVIIARGKKVLDGTLSEIKGAYGARNVALTYSRNGARAAPILNDRTLVAKHDDSGSSAEVELAEGATGDQLLRALVAAEVGLNRFEVVEPSLQAIFIDKVGPEAARAAAQGDR
jgi:ABC-2 type transport system ATP-binding protein